MREIAFKQSFTCAFVFLVLIQLSALICAAHVFHSFSFADNSSFILVQIQVIKKILLIGLNWSIL